MHEPLQDRLARCDSRLGPRPIRREAAVLMLLGVRLGGTRDSGRRPHRNPRAISCCSSRRRSRPPPHRTSAITIGGMCMHDVRARRRGVLRHLERLGHRARGLPAHELRDVLRCRRRRRSRARCAGGRLAPVPHEERVGAVVRVARAVRLRCTPGSSRTSPRSACAARARRASRAGGCGRTRCTERGAPCRTDRCTGADRSSCRPSSGAARPCYMLNRYPCTITCTSSGFRNEFTLYGQMYGTPQTTMSAWPLTSTRYCS